MARVSITVNANTYDIACPDGEEQNILDLAEGLNAKVAELVGAIGQAGEARLLAMAGLLMAEAGDEDLAEKYLCAPKPPWFPRFPKPQPCQPSTKTAWPTCWTPWRRAWKALQTRLRRLKLEVDGSCAVCAGIDIPWGYKSLSGAVPVGLVGSAYGAHLHQQATEDCNNPRPSWRRPLHI